MIRPKVYILFFILLPVILYGCETLKSSKPILPMKDYEKMIAGRFDANYVGTSSCLSACHTHDRMRQDFDASTMGIQLSKKSGMPLVNCESCHGPGSLAIEGITPEKVQENAKNGKVTKCNNESLIDLKNLPAQAKSLICLKCHSANATFNLHNWNAGTHNINEVSCSDCHDIHAGPSLRVELNETAKMCEKCHTDIKMEFMLPSHHPVPENKVFCTNCHDPHGTIADKMLRKPSVNETCAQCHAEKEGPFTYEHEPVRDDCMNCHRPHGSVNNNLLSIKVPFLCLQCHAGHRTSSSVTVEAKTATYSRCTDCHSQVHGTDIPSASGTGRFTQ